MCTETFLHLPEEKRSRFLAAAWEEFTTVSFADASINQIVRRAGVPRGSFYQYFPDKRALFFYLMELAGQYFTTEFQKIVVCCGGDLFRTQLMCFDRFVQQGPTADPLFNRCLQVLRLNSGLHLQMLPIDHPDHCMLRALWDQLDLSQGPTADPLFNRCLQVLRLNSGLHLQMLPIDHPDHCMLRALWDQLDLSSFRAQDWDSVSQVFYLSLLALAAAVKDTLTTPEEAPRHRRELCLRLEILKYGSLVPDTAANKPYEKEEPPAYA